MIGLFKGLHATISHLLTKKDTVQYPEKRHKLPERSRGLLRMRLMPESFEPRCISCTFCEQTCPATAIKVLYDEVRPGEVWTLDAGAGPMLCNIGHGQSAIGSSGWSGNGAGRAPERGCLAASLMDAGELTPAILTRTARRDGVPLSQAFGVATFYDELGPGEPSRESVPPAPGTGTVAEGIEPILLVNHGQLDPPEDIEGYSRHGGYQSVTRSLTEMTPEEVLAEITASGLKGRGGGGYEVAAKWRQARDSRGLRKYIICNTDESDRDSIKDRSLLENNPHAVIEGMMVAGYATGADKGVIYLCADYELAAERVSRAIEQATHKGILGEEIPGTKFSFKLAVVAVPRAFLGGEETVLLNVLQSRRPMPEMRPPYPAESGLKGMPTVVENTETLAAVPWIINHGGSAFNTIGNANSPGTKLFMLAGAVAEPGLYEATHDFSLKRLVTESAGGFIGEPQGALVGGTGGGILSPGLFDIPLDYDALAETGGDLSAGTIMVLGRDDCVVSTVRRCLDFSAGESCGKCTPCRLGLSRLSEMIGSVCMGEGDPGVIDLAAELARDIADSAFCNHGRTAVKPLLTGLEFFADDFQAHAEGKGCASGKCGGS
jgi:NADH-quinone oxidoreductase subunit F